MCAIARVGLIYLLPKRVNTHLPWEDILLLLCITLIFFIYFDVLQGFIQPL